MPALNGMIDRRILINYRVEPEIVKRLLPVNLEPIVINDYASAGICLLRLKNIGIKCSPAALRITSENAAHRFLVRQTKQGQETCGVYIPRRDTDSMLNVLLARKIFSWPHYYAQFDVAEAGGNYHVSMESEDRYLRLHVHASVDNTFPDNSMFESIDHASHTFQHCSVGVSPSTIPNQLNTIRLRTERWSVKPLLIHTLTSSFFEDRSIFPEGSIHFDHALLMEGIAHEWV